MVDHQKFLIKQATDLDDFKNKQASDLKDIIQVLLIKQSTDLHEFKNKQDVDLRSANDANEKAKAEFEGMLAAMGARAAYDRDMPPPKPIRDEVLMAMQDPDVNGARMAFVAYVDEVMGGALVPTNYYDKVLGHALMAIGKDVNEKTSGGTKQNAKILRLVELYCAFVDALAPFQPDDDELRSDAPRLPWEDTSDKTAKVFYYLQGSGGYWISNGSKLREMLVVAAAAAADADADANANANANANADANANANVVFAGIPPTIIKV